MSNALLRRNSSKQGLQNLMRLTAQRSIEDAEEIERERRRKARESLRRRTSHLTPEDSSPETEAPAERNLYDHEPKPSCSLSLEEDEGFSDWSQRKEKQRQQHLQELSQDGEEEEDEETVFLKNDVSNKALHTLPMPFSPFQKHDQDDINSIRMKVERTTDYEEEAKTVKGREEITDRVLLNTKKEIQRLNTEEEKKKEVKVSNTSKLIRCQKTTHNIPKSDIASEEVRPFMKRSNTSSRRVVESEELKPFLEAEQRLVKIRQSLQEKESQELEKMRHRQFEAEHELEELKRRREERRRAREGEERQKEEEEKQHLAVEEEERRKMREDMERRRMEAAERVKSLSTSRVDGELFSPFTPKVSAQKNLAVPRCLLLRRSRRTLLSTLSGRSWTPGGEGVCLNTSWTGRDMVRRNDPGFLAEIFSILLYSRIIIASIRIVLLPDLAAALVVVPGHRELPVEEGVLSAIHPDRQVPSPRPLVPCLPNTDHLHLLLLINSLHLLLLINSPYIFTALPLGHRQIYSLDTGLLFTLFLSSCPNAPPDITSLIHKNSRRSGEKCIVLD